VLKFFDQILQHIHYTDIAKEEFIEFSRASFQDNQVKLRQIERFKSEYTLSQAISFYTQDTFFHQLLNRTLQTDNMFNSIFKCRLFLADLVSRLNVVQSHSSNIIHYPYITYRGQSMSTEEIERLKSAVGDSIFLKQFLSTSLDKNIARVFAESSLSTPFYTKCIIND
jgi:hypothetical protein